MQTIDKLFQKVLMKIHFGDVLGFTIIGGMKPIIASNADV